MAEVTTETEIADADWEGEDLSGQEHERVLLRSVDLTDAVSRGASFVQCTFRECRFNGSKHVGTGFVNCTFDRCAFFDTTFEDCKMMGSRFQRCSLDLLVAKGGDWSFVGLAGADLRRASFRDLRMREADLTAARADGGRLRGTDLSGALWQRASLVGTDLRGSDLSSLDPTSVTLAKAIIDPDQAITVALALGLDVELDDDDRGGRA